MYVFVFVFHSFVVLLVKDFILLFVAVVAVDVAVFVVFVVDLKINNFFF